MSIDSIKQEVEALVNTKFGANAPTLWNIYNSNPGSNTLEYWETVRQALSTPPEASPPPAEAGEQPFATEPVVAAEPTPAEAGQPAAESDFSYEDKDGSIVITGYLGSSKKFAIPSQINGKTVTHIANKAFYGGSFEDIIIPETVTHIGREAFASNYLTTLIIPDSVKSIDIKSFSQSRTVNLTIGKGLSKIPMNAFSSNKIVEVIIPDNIIEVDTGAFANGELALAVIPDAALKMGDRCFGKAEVKKASEYDGQPFTSAAPVAAPPPTQQVVNEAGVVICAVCKNEIVEKTSSRWFCETCGTRTSREEPGERSSERSRFEHQYKLSLEKTQKYTDSLVYEEGDWTYKPKDGYVIITGYKGSASSLQIPSQIQGLPVKEIGPKAFIEKTFSAITIPPTLTTIREFAFAYNTNLASITIPSSVESIEDSAFAGHQMKSITIQEGVKSLGYQAFQGKGTRFGEDRSLIDNIVIPGSITQMGDEAFGQCRLASVTFAKGTTIISNKCFLNNQLKSIDIPEGVKLIGKDAFNDNYLTSIKLPDSLEEIGNFAFYGSKITQLKLPANLKTIGESAFHDCTLTELVIPNGVESIGNKAFSGNQILRLTLSETLTEIGDYAFNKNKLSGFMTFPESLKTIGKYAFEKNQLSGVEIRGRTKIDEYAFSGNKISRLIIGSRVSSVGFFAFFINELIGTIIPSGVRVADYFGDGPVPAIDEKVYVEIGDTSALKLDDDAFWQAFEKKVAEKKIAMAPKAPITFHDAGGTQIASAEHNDHNAYRGTRANATIFDKGKKKIGEIKFVAPYAYKDEPENYGEINLSDGSGLVSTDGTVLYGPKGKSIKDLYIWEKGAIYKDKKKADRIEELRMGSTKAENGIGIAYNRDGVKMGEVRNAGEFAAVYAGALLALLIN